MANKECVYVIQAGNAYKIGVTKNIKQRFSTIKSHNPLALLIATIHYPKSKWLEKSLHGRFRDKRISGEWFFLSQSDVEMLEDFELDPQINQT